MLMEYSTEHQLPKQPTDAWEFLFNKKSNPFIKTVIARSDSSSTVTHISTSYQKATNLYVEAEPFTYLHELKAANTRNLRRQRSKRRLGAKISILRNLYTVTNTADLFGFLSEHPNLTGLLFEAYEEVRKHFDSEELKLEVVADSELDSTRELFVYILTSRPVNKALESLDALDETWFLDQLDRTDGLFNFNLRFV